MDGCLALVVFAVSIVLLIAPLISLGVSLQMRSRIRALEEELRALRGRFDARERREHRESGDDATTTGEAGAASTEPPLPTPPATTSAPAPTAPAEASAPLDVAPAAFDAEVRASTPASIAAADASRMSDETPADRALDAAPDVVEPVGEAAATETTPPEVTTQPDEAVPETWETVPEPAAAREAEPPAPPVTPSSPPSTPPASKPSFDWEGLVGVRLFSWIAAIALALAAVFFLKYSIDHGWLSPTIRLAAGIVTGVGLIVLCEAKFARGYRVTANALDAAGVAILYASLFAAHDMWKLISQPVAFVLMVGVTALAVVLATRRSSAFIALLGMLGGFATPALLSTGQDRPFSLFGYLLILNAGIAWVAWKKGWPVLSLLSLGFTTLYQWAWVVKFLDGPKVPIAIGIFLVFPIAAVMTIWMAKARAPEKTSRLFEWTAQAGAILPILFAFYGAAVPAFGDRQAYLFFFLLVIDAGLAVVALARKMPELLHLVGGMSTVLVVAVWFAMSWSASAWPSILWWIAAFVALYALVPEIARWREITLDGSAVAARYAAPALLFAFPVLAAIEPRTEIAGLYFVLLFVLALLLGTLAIRQDAPWLWVPSALFAVAAQAVWADRYLSYASVDRFLAVCAAFTLLYVALPVVAARKGRRLAVSRGAALPVIGAVFVLSAFAQSSFAREGWIAAVLLASVAYVGLHQLSGLTGMRVAVVVAALLAWLVFALFWSELDLEFTLARALAGVGAFALVVALAGAWRARTVARREGDGSIYFGMFVFPFVWAIAGNDDLSARTGPILGIIAFTAILFAIGSIQARAPKAHLVAAALVQVSLVVWCGAAETAGLTLVVMAASVTAAFFALSIWRIVSAIGARGSNIHAAAVLVSSLTGHFVVAVAPMGDTSPPWSLLLAAHLALLFVTLSTTWKTGWHGVAIVAAFETAVAYYWWRESPAVEPSTATALLFAALLYLPFVAYPLLLGKRAGRAIEPYLTAIVASVPFFFFAKHALDHVDFAFMAMLPLAQAGLMALLLVRLLGIEPPGERATGRLALVAGALLAFVTVAIPLQLDREWITIGWALEAAALVWLFRRIPHTGLLATSAALFVVVFVRLVLNPAVFEYHPRSTTPILNWYLYTYLVPAAAMFAVPYLLEAAGRWKTVFRNACSVGGTVLLFLLLNIEIADFYSQGDSLTFDFDAGLAQDLTYTIAWALFAIAMLVAGIMKERRIVRGAALALLVVAIAKCFLHDLMRLGGLYRVGSLVGLAVSLAVVALLLQRFVLRDKEVPPEG